MRQVLIALALAGCSTTQQARIDPPVPQPAPNPAQRGPVEIPPPALGEGQCDAKPARRLVGKTSNAALVEQVRTLTGSRVARTLLPAAIVTMDYRSDRVNVHLDGSYKIVRIRCG